MSRKQLPIDDIPRDAVACALGMHAVSAISWEVIAATISQLGFGTFDKTRLEFAVQDLSVECLDAWEGGEVPAERETIDGTRGGPAS